MANEGGMIKLMMRYLPPEMTEKDLREEISPLPDSLQSVMFHQCNKALFEPEYRFNRAYLDFSQREDAKQFVARWHDYVFVDKRGIEYNCQVELAPQQRSSARPREHKQDPKSGTIESDLTFINFMKAEAAQLETQTTTQYTLDELVLKKSERVEEDKEYSDSDDTPLVKFSKLSIDTQREHTAMRDQHYNDNFRKPSDNSPKKVEKYKSRREKVVRDSRKSGRASHKKAIKDQDKNARFDQ